MEELFKSFLETEEYIDVCDYYNAITNNKFNKNMKKSKIILDTFLHNRNIKDISKDDLAIMENILLKRFSEEEYNKSKDHLTGSGDRGTGDTEVSGGSGDSSGNSNDSSPLLQSSSSNGDGNGNDEENDCKISRNVNVHSPLYTCIDFDNLFNKSSPSKWSSYMSSDGFPLAPVYSRVPCINDYSDDEDRDPIDDIDAEVVDGTDDLDYLLDEIEL